jgi:hypothetical protein
LGKPGFFGGAKLASMPVYRVRISTYIRQTTAHLPSCPFVQHGSTEGRHPSGDELVDREATDPRAVLLDFEMHLTQSLPERLYKICRCAGGAVDERY